MKLRNKKTGEIKDAYEVLDMKEEDGVLYKYYSLAELNDEWEDYKEPKDFWFIDDEGYIEVESEEYEKHLDEMKSIGNYFETEEEAEKAVEKLKAWKRLKDHNLRVERGQRIFVNADNKLTSQKPLFVVDTYGKVENDLDLLFGGEE